MTRPNDDNLERDIPRSAAFLYTPVPFERMNTTVYNGRPFNEKTRPSPLTPFSNVETTPVTLKEVFTSSPLTAASNFAASKPFPTAYLFSIDRNMSLPLRLFSSLR